MAYPASEMIASTIAEAINTAAQMNAWDYISVGGVVTAGIGGVATAGLLFWEISKSRKERARIRSLAILQKIEKQHQKIISFLFKDSIPDNNPILWNQAYLEILKLTSINLIEIKEIKEEAETARQAFIETLKSIESSDPKKESLRWQFYTGIDDWQTNDDEWEEINKEANIGTAFSQADRFGNFNKKDGISNISPLHVIAVYHFIYTNNCPLLDNIEFRKIDPNGKDEFIKNITINGAPCEWLGKPLYVLKHFLFEFKNSTGNKSKV